MNDNELANTIADAYTDFYDDPRSIHYREIEGEYGTDALAETDAIADAIDMAIRDSESRDEPRTQQDVLETLAEW